MRILLKTKDFVWSMRKLPFFGKFIYLMKLTKTIFSDPTGLVEIIESYPRFAKQIARQVTTLTQRADELAVLSRTSDFCLRRAKLFDRGVFVRMENATSFLLRLHPESTCDKYISESLLINGKWDEPTANWLLSQYYNCNPIFIDLGANIGFFSVLAGSSSVKFKAILALEPDSNNFMLLKENLTLNGLDNVKAYQLAISDHDGHADLFLSPTNQGDHRLSGDNTQLNGKSVKVNTVTLTNFLEAHLDSEQLESPLLIKIDVQGSEAAVLRGGKTILQKASSVRIILEVTPSFLVQRGESLAGFTELVVSLGMDLFLLEPSGAFFQRTQIDAAQLRKIVNDPRFRFSGDFTLELSR